MEPLWIECQDCAGNSGAFLRSSGPTVDELILQMISLQYHETLMAAAGFQAEQLKEQAAKAFRGRYLLVIEGAIPLGLGGLGDDRAATRAGLPATAHVRLRQPDP